MSKLSNTSERRHKDKWPMANTEFWTVSGVRAKSTASARDDDSQNSSICLCVCKERAMCGLSRPYLHLDGPRS